MPGIFKIFIFLLCLISKMNRFAPQAPPNLENSMLFKDTANKFQQVFLHATIIYKMYFYNICQLPC